MVAAKTLTPLDLSVGAAHPGLYAWLDDGAGPSLRRRRVARPGVPGCPSCGLVWADYQREGRLGCADCWTTFAGQLNTELKGLHRGYSHLGKQPQNRRQAHHERA